MASIRKSRELGSASLRILRVAWASKAVFVVFGPANLGILIRRLVVTGSAGQKAVNPTMFPTLLI